MVLSRNWRRLLGIAVAAATLTACGSHADTSHQASPTPKHNDPCASAARYANACSYVTVNGADYRYSLVGGSKHPKPLALLDIGGPGLSLFGSGWPSDILSQLDKKYDVLVLDEPWVTADESSECRTSLETWYQAIRTSWQPKQTRMPTSIQDASRAIPAACTLWNGRWGWTPSTYTSAVDAILAKTERKLAAFVGFSFGSTRLAYLTNAGINVPTVDLISPFPTGTSAVALIRARQAVLNTAPKFSKALIGKQPATRSVPIAASDLAAAQVEAQYVPPAAQTTLYKHAADATLVGHLSDMLFSRYGEDDIAPSMLAFWDETCPAAHDWPTAAEAGITNVLYEVCGSQHNQKPVTPGHLKVVPCIVATRHDGIVPLPLLRRWTKTNRWPIRPGVGGHADLRNLTRCMEPGNAAGN